MEGRAKGVSTSRSAWMLFSFHAGRVEEDTWRKIQLHGIFLFRKTPSSKLVVVVVGLVAFYRALV